MALSTLASAKSCHVPDYLIKYNLRSNPKAFLIEGIPYDTSQKAYLVESNRRLQKIGVTTGVYKKADAVAGQPNAKRGSRKSIQMKTRASPATVGTRSKVKSPANVASPSGSKVLRRGSRTKVPTSRNM
jgi:hypothetical protein